MDQGKLGGVWGELGASTVYNTGNEKLSGQKVAVFKEAEITKHSASKYMGKLPQVKFPTKIVFFFTNSSLFSQWELPHKNDGNATQCN